MRYFFHVVGGVHEPDLKGIEIPTLSDARIRAVRFAADYLKERPEVIWMGEEFRIEVCDEREDVCFTFIAVGVDAPAKKGRLRI